MFRAACKSTPNYLKYVEILSEERERYAGVTKVNALTDGFKILIGILSLRVNCEITSRLWKKIS